MTLEELKQRRLGVQRREGLQRWKAQIARGGYTELVLQHRDFVWNWEKYPQARRVCDVRTRQPIKAEIACAAASTPDMVRADGAFLPFLDLGLGVPVYSSWYLPQHDPCWEGKTGIPVGEFAEVEQMRRAYPEIVRACRRPGSR